MDVSTRAKGQRLPVKRREAWGTALIVMAALVFWWGTEVWDPTRQDPAGRWLVFYFHGMTEGSVEGWVMVVSVLTGVIGAFMVVPSLIGRIRRGWLRISVICLSIAGALPVATFLAVVFILGLLGIDTRHQSRFEAADGRSVLLVESTFDADSVSIFTQYDDFHYVYNQEGRVLAGFPRVRDRNCHLDAMEELLLLTCGPDTVTISPD